MSSCSATVASTTKAVPTTARLKAGATSETVEDQILELQGRKRELAVQTLGDDGLAHQYQGGGGGNAQLDESDFLKIFGLSGVEICD